MLITLKKQKAQEQVQVGRRRSIFTLRPTRNQLRPTTHRATTGRICQVARRTVGLAWTRDEPQISAAMRFRWRVQRDIVAGTSPGDAVDDNWSAAVIIATYTVDGAPGAGIEWIYNLEPNGTKHTDLNTALDAFNEDQYRQQNRFVPTGWSACTTIADLLDALRLRSAKSKATRCYPMGRFQRRDYRCCV